jgi:hypothetical protein
VRDHQSAAVRHPLCSSRSCARRRAGPASATRRKRASELATGIKPFARIQGEGRGEERVVAVAKLRRHAGGQRPGIVGVSPAKRHLVLAVKRECRLRRARRCRRDSHHGDHVSTAHGSRSGYADCGLDPGADACAHSRANSGPRVPRLRVRDARTHARAAAGALGQPAGPHPARSGRAGRDRRGSARRHRRLFEGLSGGDDVQRSDHHEHPCFVDRDVGFGSRIQAGVHATPGSRCRRGQRGPGDHSMRR